MIDSLDLCLLNDHLCKVNEISPDDDHGSVLVGRPYGGCIHLTS